MLHTSALMLAISVRSGYFDLNILPILLSFFIYDRSFTKGAKSCSTLLRHVQPHMLVSFTL